MDAGVDATWTIFLASPAGGFAVRAGKVRSPLIISAIREGMRFVNGAPWNTQDAVAGRAGMGSPSGPVGR